jgi:hypothetical protein
MKEAGGMMVPMGGLASDSLEGKAGKPSIRRGSVREELPPLVLVMLDLASPPQMRTPRRVAIPAMRPALNDLRFKGDACVVSAEDDAAVCLGDYQLTRLALTPLDVPAMNRAFLQVRLGQARRNLSRRS